MPLIIADLRVYRRTSITTKKDPGQCEERSMTSSRLTQSKKLAESLYHNPCTRDTQVVEARIVGREPNKKQLCS